MALRLRDSSRIGEETNYNTHDAIRYDGRRGRSGRTSFSCRRRAGYDILQQRVACTFCVWFPTGLSAMALEEWTPSRITRFEYDLSQLAAHNGIANMYVGFIAQRDSLDEKRLEIEDMHRALRDERVTQSWDGQEVLGRADLRQFMRDWYEAEGMYW
jgi:hypothetical protein